MKNINWLDQFANLLVVILGISIAFWLEGYKEEVSNEEKERKYLESLLSDLEADVEALDTLLYFNKTIISSLNNLSNASLGSPFESDSALRWNVMSIQYNPPFSPQRTSYESLKSSGAIEHIDDFELRKRIIELYEQYYHGAGEYDGVLNDHVRDFVKPFYMYQIRYFKGGVLNPSFLQQPEFRNIIFTYQYLFGRKDEYYSLVRSQILEIAQEIKSHLAKE